jgi:hypothetical protein
LANAITASRDSSLIKFQRDEYCREKAQWVVDARKTTFELFACFMVPVGAFCTTSQYLWWICESGI